jgi:hypothetical protein
MVPQLAQQAKLAVHYIHESLRVHCGHTKTKHITKPTRFAWFLSWPSKWVGAGQIVTSCPNVGSGSVSK